jgi:hypothetical protein
VGQEAYHQGHLGFFWLGPRELVARPTVCLPKGQGGFGLIDFDLKAKAFAIQWVKRYFAPTPVKFLVSFVCRVYPSRPWNFSPVPLFRAI